MRRFCQSVVILLITGVSSPLVSSAPIAHAAQIWFVCSSGCDFPTIQAAINDFRVQDGDGIAIEDAGKHAGFVDATKSLTIEGDSPGIVSINAGGPVITIGQSGAATEPTVTLRNLTIAGGDATSSSPNGGGILNYGTLNLTNCTISDNSAVSSGAGISNLGTMTLTDTTVHANGAGGGGGGIDNGGHLTVRTSTFSDNGAAGGGGGILNSGTLTVSATTFIHNTAQYSGGGISSEVTATVSNSTFSANSALGGGGGGGIYNFGDLTVLNSTISGNSVTGTGGGGGIVNVDLLGHTTLGNTILAGNTASSSGPDCSGTLADAPGGHNLLGTSNGCAGLTLAKGDLFDLDPGLGPLQDNGGPTQTFLPNPGSPVIDGGDDATCTQTPVNGADQRGMVRPAGSHCDIGATEFSLPLTQGWNLMDLPSQTGITTLAGLVSYLTQTSQLGAGSVKVAATYGTGRFQLFVPGYSSNVSVQPVQGIFVLSSKTGSWVPNGKAYPGSQQITLQTGWNLVAAPLPSAGLDGTTIRDEIDKSVAGNLTEAAIYTNGSYQTYLPSQTTPFHVPATSGMWIQVFEPTTWTPT